MEETEKQETWLQRSFRFIVIFCWFGIAHLSNYLIGNSDWYYIILVALAGLFINVITVFSGRDNLINKRLSEFFKPILRVNLYFALYIVFCIGVYYFITTISGFIPESVYTFFPAILILGFLFYLIGVGFYFVEKSIKN